MINKNSSKETSSQQRGETTAVKREIHFSEGVWKPPMNVFETLDEFLIIVEIPGIDPQSIKTRFEKGKLHISGLREEPKQYKLRCVHQMEIRYGPFECIAKISENAKVSKLVKDYSNGFLIINIPKT